MNFSPFGSPSQQQRPQLQKNYSEVFDPREYECKDSIELESYARNLHNYLTSLLPQTPFPAFLFEKLEKRLDGITSILQKRCAAKGVLDQDQAKKRLQALGQRLDQPDAPTALPKTFPRGMEDLPSHPPKKRKMEPGYVQDVRRQSSSLKLLRNSYTDSEKTLEVDEEEEA